MMITRKHMTALLVFLLLAAVNVRAQSSYFSRTRIIRVPDVLDVSVTSAGSTYSFNVISDYDNGIVKSSLYTVVVKANKAWTLKISPASTNFTSGTSTTMPATVLWIKKSTDANYTNVSYASPYIISGYQRGKYTFLIDVKASPGYLFDAGDYTLQLNYQLSAP